jgi:hypothetical protein
MEYYLRRFNSCGVRGCGPEINVRLWIYRDVQAPNFGRQFAEYVNESYQGGGPVA